MVCHRRPYFNTTYSILYDHPPSHSLTLSSGCPKCKRSACEPINGHERCRKSGCYIMQLLYDVCMKWYNFLSCIINLNIIYLLKTSLIWCGNLSMNEALLPKLDSVYKIFYCTPLGDWDVHMSTYLMVKQIVIFHAPHAPKTPNRYCQPRSQSKIHL